MPGDQARALEAGCSAYIPKPIDTATFPRRVAEILHSRNEVGATTTPTQEFP
jgi:CheY-like chemotaxis protein